MTVEIISWSISTKVWDRAGIELPTPGSAVRLASVARHVTDCATRPGSMQRVKSTNCKVNLRFFVRDGTHVILFVGPCHLLSCCCIGQLYTIKWLLSDILGVDWNICWMWNLRRHLLQQFISEWNLCNKGLSSGLFQASRSCNFFYTQLSWAWNFNCS